VLRRPLEFTLRAVIGMVDETLARATVHDGRVECGGDNLGAHVGGHAPANDPAAPGVGHRGEVAEPGLRRDGRDVSDPEPIGAPGMEVAVHKIRSQVGMLVGDRRPDKPPPVDAGDVLGSHEPSDTLAGDAQTGLRKIRPDPRHAVCLAAAGVAAADLDGEGGVGDLPC
jgi:hypothetical protein